MGEDQKRQTKQLLTDNILTDREVVAYLRLTLTTVCNLAASGELPGFKIGKSWRFAAAKPAERHVSKEGRTR